MSMKFLITAFEPFGDDKENPTMKVVDSLKGLPGVDTKVLPVTFKCFDDLKSSVKDAQYDYILHLGQAGGRNKVTFEKVAINHMDARIPDNSGFQPNGEHIVKGEPDGLFTTLPVRELVRTLQLKGHPANISYTAGTYVCNYIMYSSLNYYKGTNTKVGFIHIPFSPSQVIHKDAASMEISTVVSTIKDTIEVLRNDAFAGDEMPLGSTH